MEWVKQQLLVKLASQFKKQGLKVVLGAADTFRAAAIDQLQVWADRTEFLLFVKKWVQILLL